MRNSYLVLCVLILFSCNSLDDKKNEDVWNMDVAPMNFDMNEQIDSISFIVLDDSDSDALFKGIDKMYNVDGRFYILDYMGTSSVLVFDEQGQFLFKVGNIGEGPGEYSGVTDFDVNNGCIYLLDSKKRMIISYDLEGNFP